MQEEMFGDPSAPPPARTPEADATLDLTGHDEAAPTSTRRRSIEVLPLPHDDATRTLAARLNPRIRLGASTWSYPGWAGTVWDEGPHSEAVLAKKGLTATRSTRCCAAWALTDRSTAR